MISECCNAPVSPTGICMSCKDNCPNDEMLVPRETDTTEAMYEQEVEARDREEDRYDDSYEPSAGLGSPREY